MTYLRYSNTCAELVRGVLKESVKAGRKRVASYSMVRSEWEAGKITKRSMLVSNFYSDHFLLLTFLSSSVVLG